MKKKFIIKFIIGVILSTVITINMVPVISGSYSSGNILLNNNKSSNLPRISSEVNFTEINIAYYNSNGTMWEDNIVIPNLIQWIGSNLTRVGGQDIKNGILDEMDILIFPGGEPPKYMDELGLEGKAKIQDFVEKGGAYMGICAGALYACSYVNWTGWLGADPIIDDREGFLHLFDGVGIAPIYEIVEFPNKTMTEINIQNKDHMITKSQPDTMSFLYFGGGYFQPNNNEDETILGTYAITGKSAMISLNYGRGKVFLSGPHPEIEEDDSRDGFNDWDNELNDVESDWPLLKEVIRWLATPSRNISVPSYFFVFPVTILAILVLYIRVKKKLI